MIRGHKHLHECAFIGDDSSEELEELLEVAKETGFLAVNGSLEVTEISRRVDNDRQRRRQMNENERFAERESQQRAREDEESATRGTVPSQGPRRSSEQLETHDGHHAPLQQSRIGRESYESDSHGTVRQNSRHEEEAEGESASSLRRDVRGGGQYRQTTYATPPGRYAGS